MLSGESLMSLYIVEIMGCRDGLQSGKSSVSWLMISNEADLGDTQSQLCVARE